MCPSLDALGAAVAAAAIIASAGRAQGAAGKDVKAACPVSIFPSDAAEGWRAAARTAEERLQRAGADGDCGSLAIQVAGGRASVLFTTRDGRQTVRPLDSPDEVGPLVDALLVTLPDEHDPAVEQPPIPPSKVTFVDRAPAQPAGTPARIALHAAAGGRVSSPGGFASPSFSAGAGVLVGAWELSAFGVWDPAHVLIGGGAPTGFSMSRYAVGVAVGRRVPVGGVSVAFGVGTGVAVTSEAAADVNGTGGGQTGGGQTGGGQTGGGQNGGLSQAEPLVAAYGGLVYPRRSPVRLRSELSAEVIGRTTVIDPALPTLPWWSGSASLGVEWEMP
jgi:hypothetical protein